MLLKDAGEVGLDEFHNTRCDHLDSDEGNDHAAESFTSHEPFLTEEALDIR